MRRSATLGRLIALLPGFFSGCVQPTAPTLLAPESYPQAMAQPGRDILELEQVREMVGVSFCGTGFEESYNRWRATIIGWGERAFPSYEAILADPKSHPWQVRGTCFAIREVKTDRRRFVSLAAKRFSAADAMVQYEGQLSEVDAASIAGLRALVRTEAVHLLQEIGDEWDTAPLMPLLSDDRSEVRSAVATAVAKIGGKRDLEAMDSWLKDGKHPKDGDYLIYVKKCRDELEARLKARPFPKDTMN